MWITDRAVAIHPYIHPWVSNVATFQWPYDNNVATYRLMWPRCIKAWENKAFCRRALFARKRGSRPQKRAFFLLSSVSSSVIFGAFFCTFVSWHVLKTGWVWNLSKNWHFGIDASSDKKPLFWGVAKCCEQERWPLFWPSLKHYKHRIFRVSRGKRWKNRYFKRWSAERNSGCFVGFILFF